jgi:sigma-B regulation protein RsbU (phosphoserine phosphatase)
MIDDNPWVSTELRPRYRAAVEDCLSGTTDEARVRSYELGCQAVVEKVTAPELAAMHHQEMHELCHRVTASGSPNALQPTLDRLFQQASVLLETALRGYEEALRIRDAAYESVLQAHQTLLEADREKDRMIADFQRDESEVHRLRAESDQRSVRQNAELAAARERLRAEITERQLTEVALRESEARFRIIFERAGLGIALLDKLGRIRESNPALQQMLAYDGEELHGKTVFDVTAPGDLEVTRRSFQDLVEGQRSEYRLEKRFIQKAGTLVWVRKTVSGVYGPTGELQFAIGLIENVTERKLAERNLSKSEARFRQVADMTGEWICEQDAEGRYIYSSSAVQAILGYAAGEVLGKFYYELFTAEDQKRVVPDVPSMIASKEAFHRIVNRYQHQQGHEVFTESTGAPIFDTGGNLVKWRGVDRDVTERKRYEDALRLRDRAIEASSVGIIITDPHQRGNPIIYANPAFVAMTGHPREEVMGRNPGFLQGPDTDPLAIEQIRRALQEGCDCHLTLKNYRKDGSAFWNELLISPVRDDQGKLTHFIGTQTDVTALRRLEEERHEMEIAKQIQLSLLPTAPLSGNGVLVAGMCLPATHLGGDYFDYFSSGTAVDVVIADVSGHSVAAAMIMAEARTTLKMETHRMLKETTGLPKGAAAILSNLNDLLFADLNRSDRFITMFYAQYDSATLELTYANAGHNRPLLLRQGSRICSELDAEGLILGVREDPYFEERRVRLRPGDAVLLYTDGITEAQSREGEFFGADRLRAVFAEQSENAPQDIIDGVMANLRGFCGSKAFSDDVSLVVLKLTRTGRVLAKDAPLTARDLSPPAGVEAENQLTGVS